MLKTTINRKRATTALITGLFVVCSVAFFVAAVKYDDGGSGTKIRAEGQHDVGNFWLTVTNQLTFSGPEAQYGGEWPGGSGEIYIYDAGIWIGYINLSGDIYVSAWRNGNPADDWGEVDPSTYAVLMSNDSNWSGVPAGVEQVSELDSFVAVTDDVADELGPIGIEVWRQGYQWGTPGHDDFIVFEYTAYNYSGSTLPGVYMAMPFDNDVGGGLDYIDDLVLFEGENNNADEWNNPTEPGIPWTAPGADGIPDVNDAVNFAADDTRPRLMSVMYDSGGLARDFPGYIGCRLIGCTMSADTSVEYEVSAQHSWDIQNDPTTDAHRYGYMLDVGTFEEITTPYDWRMCQSVGPFADWPANETIHWWQAVVMGADLNDMRMNSDQVYADYLGADGVPGTGDDWIVVSPPTSPRLVAVKGDANVTLRWNPEYDLGRNLETEADTRSGVVDFDGYVIWRSSVGFDTGWQPVIWIDKPSSNADMNEPWGWHAGERVPDGEWVDTDNPPDGEPNNDGHPFNEPDLRTATRIEYDGIDDSSAPVRKDNKGYYEWVDSNVVNGTTYYYSVTPYDFGSLAISGGVEPVIGGKNANAVSGVPIMKAVSNLDKVTVVPNPYRGSADWEEWTGSGIRLGKIWFMNLPEECTITIYTISGDPVRIIEHRSNEIGAEAWDLTGGSGVQVASGVYVYQVEAGDETKIGKFAVIVGQN